MRRDLEVVGADEDAASFQGSADATVDRRGLSIEVDASNVAQENVESLLIPLPVGALLGAVSQLGNGDGADAQIARRRLLNSLGQSRKSAVQIVDARIRIEQVPYSKAGPRSLGGGSSG